MNIYMVLFDILIFAATFTVLYLYWNTPTNIPLDLTTTESSLPIHKDEGFTTQSTLSDTLYNITMCPGVTKSYVAKNGDNLCCDGNPAGTECEGVTVCTLSNINTAKKIPSCASYLRKYYNQKALQLCPKDLPQYYEDSAGIGFCTNDRINKEMNAPHSTTASKCSVKATDSDPTSCKVLRALDVMHCPSPGCIKQAVALARGAPLVLQANFIDASKVSHACYDKASYFRYWEAILGPDWKSKVDINPDTNIMFCDVAKAYYIDKTLTKKNVSI